MVDIIILMNIACLMIIIIIHVMLNEMIIRWGADWWASRLVCLVQECIIDNFYMHIRLALTDQELHCGHLVLLFVMAGRIVLVEIGHFNSLSKALRKIASITITPTAVHSDMITHVARRIWRCLLVCSAFLARSIRWAGHVLAHFGDGTGDFQATATPTRRLTLGWHAAFLGDGRRRSRTWNCAAIRRDHSFDGRAYLLRWWEGFDNQACSWRNFAAWRWTCTSRCWNAASCGRCTCLGFALRRRAIATTYRTATAWRSLFLFGGRFLSWNSCRANCGQMIAALHPELGLVIHHREHVLVFRSLLIGVSDSFGLVRSPIVWAVQMMGLNWATAKSIAKASIT